MKLGDAEWIAWLAEYQRRAVYTYSLGSTIVYVGCSQELHTRTLKHRRESHWLLPCMTLDVVAVGLLRQDALDLELELIREHRPMFNLQGNFDYNQWRRGGRPRKAAA
jgi:excinuclease UvrABC nuclease subunit